MSFARPLGLSFTSLGANIKTRPPAGQDTTGRAAQSAHSRATATAGNHAEKHQFCFRGSVEGLPFAAYMQIDTRDYKDKMVDAPTTGPRLHATGTLDAAMTKR